MKNLAIQHILELVRSPLMWLLLAVPVAVGLEHFHAPGVWIFGIAALAILPLAALMGKATEQLAVTLGSAMGGLLNATFGNAAELIIALVALSKGPEMYDLVKASITGSIIGNILLVLGLSILCGGLKYRKQHFNKTSAGMGATLLALASIGLVLPTLHFYFYRLGRVGAEASPAARGLETLSEEIAAILALVYVLSLVFQLRTHRDLMGEDEGHHEEAKWSRRFSICTLLGATATIAWMSELLVASVSSAASTFGMNSVFVGVIVVAVIGNAAEHSTAILVAMKNKMDLAMGIAVGSSIQVALFVAPFLVFASLWMGHAQPLDLHFTPLEVTSVILSTWVLSLISHDGETHWMEGVLLLAVYGIIALAFFNLPG